MLNGSRIVEDYNKTLRSMRLKTLQLTKKLVAVFVVLTIIFAFFMTQNTTFFTLFFVFLGLSALFIFIFILISVLPYSKPTVLYNTIYEEVLKDINYNEDVTLEYQFLTKEREYNIAGGLFTRAATISNRYQLEYLNQEGHQVNMYDTTIVTRSDKSTTIHFDGTYFVFKMDNRDVFQLRSKYSPKLRKTKFNKINERDDIKEYVKEEDRQTISKRFYTLFDYLNEHYPNRRIFIGGIDKEIHVALWIDKRRNKYQVLKIEDLDIIRKDIMDKIALGEDIYTIIGL